MENRESEPGFAGKMVRTGVMVTGVTLVGLVGLGNGCTEKEQEVVDKALNNPINKFTPEEKELIVKRANEYKEELEELKKTTAKLQEKNTQYGAELKGLRDDLKEMRAGLSADREKRAVTERDYNEFKESTNKTLEEIGGQKDSPIFACAGVKKDKDGKVIEIIGKRSIYEVGDKPVICVDTSGVKNYKEGFLEILDENGRTRYLPFESSNKGDILVFEPGFRRGNNTKYFLEAYADGDSFGQTQVRFHWKK